MNYSASNQAKDPLLHSGVDHPDGFDGLPEHGRVLLDLRFGWLYHFANKNQKKTAKKKKKFSDEKMTLTISVLLSIVVFLLLVSKILPPTSSSIPLMAKYLLLTFTLNVITILVSGSSYEIIFNKFHTYNVENYWLTPFYHIKILFLS
jgi:hypothetical protein